MADQICFRERKGKTYWTSVSCETDETNCCFFDRIFTFTSQTIPSGSRVCKEGWPKCGSNSAVTQKSRLSNAEKVWINVFCVLIVLTLLVVAYALYRLSRQKKKRQKRNNSSKSVMVKLDSYGSYATNSGLSEPILISAAVGSTIRESSPIDGDEKLLQLIKSRNVIALTAFLETIDKFNDVDIDPSHIGNARGILEAWRTDEKLQKFCNREGKHLNTWELTNLQKTIRKAEDMTYNEYILSFDNAKQILMSELSRQNLINDLKVRMTWAMQNKNIEKLKILVEEIYARQLDNEFGKELECAENQMKQSGGKSDVTETSGKSNLTEIKRNLSNAIGRRDTINLTEAIERAEKSQYKMEVNAQLDQAKRTMNELQEIEKLKSSHKDKIRHAIGSGDVTTIKQTLLNLQLDGFGETLKTEINDLKKALKNNTLLERLNENLSTAVQSFDVIKITRAIAEVTAAGFSDKLRAQIKEAQELLLKLHNLEINKKSVMELEDVYILELKSYLTPPIQVHNTIKALLIVLGVEQKISKDWSEIHVFLSEASNPSLKQLVQNYSYDDLSKENASKAAHVIRDISCSELQEMCKAAHVFHTWTLAAIENRLLRIH